MTSSTSTVLENEQDQEKDISTSKDEEEGVTVSVQPASTQTTFPEGGLTAWMAIAGAFLIQYTCFGYINAFGVYQDYYVRVYLTGFTPSDIGWIGGVQIFLNFSLGAITGKIFDRGYFKHLLFGCIALQALALYTLSLSKENSYYQVFLTNGIALGLSCGLSYVPSLGIAGHYFHKRRSLAVGIISSGSALGAILHPIMLNKFFNGPVGFHNGVRISASLNAFLLLVAALITKPRLPPKEAQRFPIGKWLKEPAYLVFLFGGVFAFLGLFFPVFYLQLDAIKHGVDKDFSFYALSILNAASVFGRTLPGYLAPRLGVFNLGAFFTAGTGIIVLCMAAIKNEAGTVVFAIFFGLFSGACIALTPAILAHLAKDASEIGTRMGLYFAIGGVLGLFATPIAGALLTSDYVWIRPITFAGVTMVISGILCGISRQLYGRGKTSYIL